MNGSAFIIGALYPRALAAADMLARIDIFCPRIGRAIASLRAARRRACASFARIRQGKFRVPQTHKANINIS